MAPIQLFGTWQEGYALDVYMESSEYIGEDVFGHPMFDNTYSQVGKLLHRMKYNGRENTSWDIVRLYDEFLTHWMGDKYIDAIIAVPPTNVRNEQPVFLFAEALSERSHIPFSPDVLEKVSFEQAKNMPRGEKKLKGAIVQKLMAKRMCNILLVDDFYSSGATARECVSVLRRDEQIKNIYYLAIANISVQGVQTR